VLDLDSHKQEIDLADDYVLEVVPAKEGGSERPVQREGGRGR
jgi:hypothetical protein